MQFWKVKALTYLSGIYLYRWYALAVAWVLCIVGWSVVATMPDQYRAEARVYIDTQNMMDPLLRGLTISIDPTQEISVMLRTLITRPTLEQVIHLTNPKSSSFTPAQLEQQVQALQDKISIRQLETKNYYAIGYTDTNSQYTTLVTQTLLSILQDNRVGSTRLDMDLARSFINKKVQEYEDRLRDADKRRADFRTANIDILSKGTAANRIDAAEAALDTARKELSAMTARRDTFRQQLAATPKQVAVDERMFLGAGPAGLDMNAVGAKAAANAATNPVQRMQQAQLALDELRTRYTEQHPDVIAQKKLIAQLQAQMTAKPNEGDPSSVMVPNPVYVQMQARLADEETNVAVQRQRVDAALSERDRAKNDASKAIDVLSQFNGLDRDYGNIENTYKELLQSRESASLSQARDDQNQGISFRVLEPPLRPQFPVAPNRLLMNSAVFVFGIGGGIGLALLLMLNGGRLVTSEDIVAEFGVPLLGVVTSLPRAVITANRYNTLALSSAAALLVISYVGVLAVFRTSIYSVLGI